MAPRLFTVEQAEALLPQLAPLLWQLRQLKEEHDASQKALAALQAKAAGNGHGMDGELGQARAGLQHAVTGINAIIERVQGMGCELKDMEMGLIDFRSEMDGREVYLCWKLGEENIGWWHETDSGFSSRRPLRRVAHD